MGTDHGGFDAFVEEHGHALLRTALLLTGDQHAAQDLLQDALEQALRRWPRKNIEFPAAYVRTTMVRLVQRRRMRKVVASVELGDQQSYPSAPDDVRGVDERRVLLSALARLPARQRSAVVLRHWQGYSVAETAQIMKCSQGTVKSQTSHALVRLRDLCGPSFPEWGDPEPPESAPATAVPAPLDESIFGGPR
ncbi:SigE family RNA polymerase sigma factor [Oerskovia turbata]